MNVPSGMSVQIVVYLNDVINHALTVGYVYGVSANVRKISVESFARLKVS